MHLQKCLPIAFLPRARLRQLLGLHDISQPVGPTYILLNVAIRNYNADFDYQILVRMQPSEQLSSKDRNGQTPLQIALARGPAGQTIVEGLLKAGAVDHRTL